MDINELINALEEVKSITKRVSASDWTPEFRETVKVVHRTLRDHANVDGIRCAMWRARSRQAHHCMS
jgi:hypothetical protein